MESIDTNNDYFRETSIPILNVHQWLVTSTTNKDKKQKILQNKPVSVVDIRSEDEYNKTHLKSKTAKKNKSSESATRFSSKWEKKL